MERTRIFTMRFLLILFFTLVNIFVFAQSKADLKCRFKHFFIKGDMDKWAELVDSLQSVDLNENDTDVLLYAEYGLIGYYISQERYKEAKIVLEIFDNRLEKQIELKPVMANYHAFKAAGYGFKIGLSPWKAPFLSIYHQKSIDNALKYRKSEILPLIEQANSYYFRPYIFGGNKSKALLYYEKANKLLAQINSCNWVYFSNSSWLGQVYTKLKMPQKARAIYLKLLNEEPDFQFVKNELLPQLEKGEFNDIGGRFEKLYE